MTIEEAIKQKAFENNWQRALVNLHFTSNWFRDHLMAALKPYKINDQHYNILRILKGRYPECASPGDIKEVLINKRGDLTRLLDKLDKLGYVDRATNSNNRRMVDIIITQAGIQLLQELNTIVSTVERLKMNLSAEEALQLSLLLDKMRQ